MGGTSPRPLRPSPTASPTRPPWCTAAPSSPGAQFDRRADGVAATLLDRGCVEQDKVAQYLYNGPEYLETMFAAFKAGLAAGEHQLPLRRRRARLPVGQRRRRRPSCSTARSPTAVRARSATGSPASRRGCGSTTAPGPAPSGRSTTRRRAAAHRTRAHRRSVGPRRRRPAAALHRRHDRHAQGRHVAPGRPVRRAAADRRQPTPPGEGDLDGVRRARSPGRARSTCRPPADARHRVVQRASRRCSSAAAIVTTRAAAHFDAERAARHDRASTGRTSVAIVGDAFAKPMLRALDAEPGPLGHLVAARASSRPA